MQTIRTLFDIITFKAKPKDVPFDINYSLLAFCIACASAYLPVSSNPLIQEPGLFVFVQKATLAILIATFLSISKKQERITQTLLAFFGTLSIFQIALYVLSLLNVNIMLLILSIWNFVVQIFIIRHALSIGKIQSFFIVVAFQMSILFVLTLAFPEVMQDIIALLKSAQAQIGNTVTK